MDSIIRMLLAHSSGHRVHRYVLRACADDLGLVLRHLRTLRALVRLFSGFERASGLALKISKCVLVPLARQPWAALAADVQRWLCTEVPAWSAFCVSRAAKYLGAHIGPGAHTVLWTSQMQKFLRSVDVLRDASTPISMTALLYNTVTVQRLAFLCQFSELPDAILRAERHLLGRILHLPGSTLATHGAHALEEWGLPPLTSLRAFAAAIAWRAATRTLSWRAIWAEYLALASEELPSWDWWRGQHFDARWWDGPPFAAHLASAASGWHGGPLQEPGAQILRDARAWTGAHQGQAYHIIKHSLYPVGSFWRPKFSARLARLGVPFPHADDVAWGELRLMACACRPSLAFAVFRTLGNAWTTSHRMHSHLASDCKCIAGCDAEDSLRHYLHCPRLWAAAHLATAAFLAAPTTLSHGSPDPVSREAILERLGLIGLSKFTFVRLAVLCRIYHMRVGALGRPLSQARRGEVTLASLASTGRVAARLLLHRR